MPFASPVVFDVRYDFDDVKLLAADAPNVEEVCIIYIVSCTI
jgi:hypothetical protein